MFTHKSRKAFFVAAVLLISVHQFSFAQQSSVNDLIEQYGQLLKPSTDESNNTLSYTQAYLELKKKVDALNPDDRTTFENGIKKYSSDPNYANLHAMLFDEGGQSTDVSSQGSAAASGGESMAVATVDSTIQMQVFDRRHKVINSMVLKPDELQNKMTTDGYHVTVSSYDFTTKKATVTLAKSDASGTTAKVTFLATGECDIKCKLANGKSLSVHSGIDANPTLQLGTGKKK